MAPLKFGLLGTGYWASSVHATALAASPHATLEGVWGRDPAKAQDLAAGFGAKGFDDLDELLGAVDAVSIALPPAVQAGLAVRAARAGCHLLLDKPVALDVGAAQAVVDAVERADVAALVFFTNRYRPDRERWAQEAAEAGPWDAAHLVQYANIFQPGSPYATSDWRRQYGALWDLGPHALALVVPLMGKVTSVAARRGPTGTDTVHLVLTHEPRGSVTTLSMSLTMPPAAAGTGRLALYGESGARTQPEFEWEPVEAFGEAVRELAGLVASGDRRHRCDAHFGLEVVRALAAAEQALGLPAIELDH